MGGVRSDTRLAAQRPSLVAPKCAVAQIVLSSSFPGNRGNHAPPRAFRPWRTAC